MAMGMCRFMEPVKMMIFLGISTSYSGNRKYNCLISISTEHPYTNDPSKLYKFAYSEGYAAMTTEKTNRGKLLNDIERHYAKICTV